jgi:hypothetical protein
MRIFFYVGRNEALKSGISSKIWKIARKGRIVQSWWGRAKYDVKSRRVRPEFELLTKSWRFPSMEQAEVAMRARIAAKINEGYQRSPRRRKRSNAVK